MNLVNTEITGPAMVQFFFKSYKLPLTSMPRLWAMFKFDQQLNDINWPALPVIAN